MADGLVVAGGAEFAGDLTVATYVQTAYGHFKTIGAWDTGADVLVAAGVALDGEGIVTTEAADEALAQAIKDALGRHRHWDRPTSTVLSGQDV